MAVEMIVVAIILYCAQDSSMTGRVPAVWNQRAELGERWILHPPLPRTEQQEPHGMPELVRVTPEAPVARVGAFGDLPCHR